MHLRGRGWGRSATQKDANLRKDVRVRERYITNAFRFSLLDHEIRLSITIFERIIRITVFNLLILLFIVNNREFCHLSYNYLPVELRPNSTIQLCILHENFEGKDKVYQFHTRKL